MFPLNTAGRIGLNVALLLAGVAALHFGKPVFVPLLISLLPLKNDITRPATARLLLQAGANPNIPNNKGETPLMLAARSGDQELLQLLLGVRTLYAV